MRYKRSLHPSRFVRWNPVCRLCHAGDIDATDRHAGSVLIATFLLPVRHENRRHKIQITGQLNHVGEIELIIADNGIGFGEEELEQIRQFLPCEITLKTDGTGFGLPTAKRYVAAHGGTLRIESAPGTGTTVTVTLPREQREEVAA